MSFDAITKKIGFSEQVFEHTGEQSLNADITLPDYCPEIQRILKCEVSAYVTNVQNSAGRVTADATANVKIIYAAENGKTGCYEQSYPLQKVTESSRLEGNVSVTVKVSTDYANCRAVSPRRVEVHAVLTFVFRAFARREESLLCEACGSGLQAQTRECETVSAIGSVRRSLPMSEVVEVGSDKPAIFQIMNVSSCAIPNDVKLINGKMLLKGSLNLKISYIGDGCESIESIEHTMPISQIIELEGLNEQSIYSLELDSSGTQAVPKVDSAGTMRLIDISVPLVGTLSAWDRKTIELISDLYSTEFETQTELRSVEIRRYLDSTNTSFVNKASIDCRGNAPSVVLASWCSELKYSLSGKDDSLAVNGTYTANVLYRDKEGQTAHVAKPVDFEHFCRLKEGAPRIISEGDMQVTACSSAATGDGNIEMQTELLLSAAAFCTQVERYVGDVTVNEEAPKEHSDCALTVYYCGKDEKLWDIAKSYNTTVEAIRSENRIDSDMPQNGDMLLIPR